MSGPDLLERAEQAVALQPSCTEVFSSSRAPCAQFAVDTRTNSRISHVIIAGFRRLVIEDSPECLPAPAEPVYSPASVSMLRDSGTSPDPYRLASPADCRVDSESAPSSRCSPCCAAPRNNELSLRRAYPVVRGPVPCSRGPKGAWD